MFIKMDTNVEGLLQELKDGAAIQTRIEEELNTEREHKTYLYFLEAFVKEQNLELLEDYPKFKTHELIQTKYEVGPLYLKEGNIYLFTTAPEHVVFQTDRNKSVIQNAKSFLDQKDEMLEKIITKVDQEVTTLIDCQKVFNRLFNELRTEFIQVLNTPIGITRTPIRISEVPILNRNFFFKNAYSVSILVNEKEHFFKNPLESDGFHKDNIYWSNTTIFKVSNLTTIKEIMKKQLSTLIESHFNSEARAMKNAITQGKKFKRNSYIHVLPIINVITDEVEMNTPSYKLNTRGPHYVELYLNASEEEIQNAKNISNIQIKIDALTPRLSRIVRSLSLSDEMIFEKGYNLTEGTINSSITNEGFQNLLKELSTEISKVNKFEFFSELDDIEHCKLTTEIFYRETSRFVFEENEYIVFHYKGLHDRKKKKKVFKNGTAIPVNQYFKVLRKYNLTK